MERSGFHFKFIEKGYEWGSKEERQRATPQLVTNTGPSFCSGPLTPHTTPDEPGLRNGTAAPHTHTQARRDTQLPRR